MARDPIADARRLVDATDLPGAIRDRILEIVHEGALSSFEQVDVARELIAHFEDATAAGRGEAEMLREFGDTTAAAATVRSVKRRARLRDRSRERMGRDGDSIVFVVARDLRYAVRRLIQSPAFSLLAIASLALGIGANTALFSVVNGLLLQQLPVADPERVVEIYETSPDFEYNVFSYPDAVDFEERTRSVFASLAYASISVVQVIESDEVETLMGETVSGGYFDTIGLDPALGRLLGPDDNLTIGGHPVVVLSYSHWQRRYGGSPDVLGEVVVMSGVPMTIVGVAPEAWTGTLQRLDLAFYAPAVMSDALEQSATARLQQRRMHSWFMKGRLLPGVGLEQVESVMANVADDLKEMVPQTWTPDRGFLVLHNSDVVLFPSMDGPITVGAWLLLAVVGMVLLLACANLAGFLLARAVGRRKEIALRLALGATRGKLIGQLLVETVLLGVIGGLAGLGAAAVFLRWLGAFQFPFAVPLTFEFAMDARVLAFAVGVSLLSGVLFGLFPALQSTRPDLVSTLRDETAGAGGGHGSRVRSALVVAQVAVSVVLLVIAGLTLRSVWEVYTLDAGFGNDPSVILTLAPPATVYDVQETQQLYEELTRAFLALPGVATVGHTDNLHLNQLNTQSASVDVDGYPPPEGRRGHTVDIAAIDPEALDALGIRIVEGRNFTLADEYAGRPVAIISEAMARRFFPEGAVGQTFRQVGSPDVEVTVVGVASDTLVRQIGETYLPMLYRPSAQLRPGQVTFVLRTPQRDPASLTPRVLEIVRDLAPQALVFESKTMEDHLEVVRFPMRVAAIAFALFAGLALTLATIGIYGLMSYTQAQRASEVGIRLSLGAEPRAMVRLLVTGGMRLTAIGLVIGLVVAIFLARVASAVLFNVGPWDPMTWVAVVGVLATVALAAAWMPARRASRIDPAIALRCE